MRRIGFGTRARRILRGRSRGMTLIEVLVALALFSIIAIVFLSGLTTASRAVFIGDQRTTAESLARSQMEYVKNLPYDSGDEPSYDPAVPQEFTEAGYSATVDAVMLEDGLQTITIRIYHHDEDRPVFTLEGYKRARD